MNTDKTTMKFSARGMLSLLIILLAGIIHTNSVAQDKDPVVRERPFQLTFLYPIGSNGIRSHFYENHFSINLLAGMSAGVKAFELGGLGNFTRGNVSGFQAAGLANVITGGLRGTQLGGLVNFNQGDAHGTQIAGLLNLGLGNVRGVQIAGLVNAPVRDVRGLQVAGIANVSLGRLKGWQLGLTNVAVKEARGGQIGLINYSRKLKGFQLGLINVADSVESGAGFGLINYYRNGYHPFEIGADETFYVNATFKSGVDKLYLIYTIGYKTKGDRQYWAPGIGVGSLWRVSQKIHLNTDLVARQVNEDEWWTEKLNLLNTLKVNFAYNFNEHYALFIGPTLNVVVSGIEDVEGQVIGDSFSPWDFYDHTGRGNRVKMYLGLNAGIRF